MVNSMGIKNKTALEFSQLVSFGENNNQFIDKLCAFFLALSPILWHYKGPFQDCGHSILIIFFPFVVLKLLMKLRRFNLADLGVVAMLIMYNIYRVVAHGATLYKFGHRMLIVVYLLALALGCINVKHIIKTAYYVAIAASVCIILQYICYYGFGFHLQLVPTALLLPRAEQWVLNAKTGLAGITGRLRSFYRPSAFFLEPSHMFLYIFPHLLIMLLSKNTNRWRIRRAILFTVGLLLSTSGMGIAVAVGAWGLFLGMSSGKENIIKLRYIFKPKNVMTLVLLLILIVGLYFNVPVFTKSVDRIINSNSGSDAISGRTTQSVALVKSITGANLIFGVSDSITGIDFNLPGFMVTVYRYGLIGILLSYSLYVRGLLKLKAQYFWISFVVIVVSFFSQHTHETFYMFYYISILLEGNYQLKLQKRQSFNSNLAADMSLVWQ